MNALAVVGWSLALVLTGWVALFEDAAAADAFERAGLRIGDGVNSLTGEGKGECLAAGYRPPNDPGKTPQRVTYAIDRLESTTDLAKRMNVDIGGSLALGYGTVKGKASWVLDQSLNQYSIYLLVTVTVENAAREISGATIDSQRLATLNRPDGVRNFKAACGDEYVRGMKTGGQYHAIFELRTRSEREKQVVSAAIKAKGVAGSWTAEADFSSAVEQASKLSTLSSRQYREGPSSSIPDTPDEIIRFAKQFPVLVAGAGAWDYMATTRPYSDLPDWPPNISIRAADQRRALDSMAEAELRARSVLASFYYVQTNVEQFLMSTGFERLLGGLEEELLKYQEEVAAAAMKCAEKGECKAFPLSRLFEMERRLPQRKADKTSAGRCKNNTSGLGRFASMEGGCRDLSSGITWSASTASAMPYLSAADHCVRLIQDGVAGWILPSASDLRTLEGVEGAVSGLPVDPAHWYWSSDKQRVTLVSGLSKPFDQGLGLEVLCRRAASR